MNKYMIAGALFSVFATGAYAASPTGEGCDQWGLSGKELTDCRTQWAKAKNDTERDRVKALFVSPAFINSTTPNAATGSGSSTPPDNLRGPAGSAQPGPTSPAATGSPSSVAKPSPSAGAPSSSP